VSISSTFYVFCMKACFWCQNFVQKYFVQLCNFWRQNFVQNMRVLNVDEIDGRCFWYLFTGANKDTWPAYKRSYIMQKAFCCFVNYFFQSIICFYNWNCNHHWNYRNTRKIQSQMLEHFFLSQQKSSKLFLKYLGHTKGLAYARIRKPLSSRQLRRRIDFYLLAQRIRYSLIRHASKAA